MKIFRFKLIVILFLTYLALNPLHSQTTNLAQGKATDQSSVRDGKSPSNAVDGKTTGTFADNDISCTAQILGPHWWQVDLGDTYEISKVTIYKAKDDSSASARFGQMYISVSDDPTFNGSQIVEGYQSRGGVAYRVEAAGQPTFTRLSNATGRYVRVWTNRTRIYLAFAEVEVYGTEKKVDLNSAISSGNSDQMKSIIANGASATERETILKKCVDDADIDMIETVLEKKSAVPSSVAAYAFSSDKYNSRVTSYLVENGDIEVSSAMQITAIDKNDTKTIQAIIAKDKSMMKRDAVRHAFRAGRTEMVESIINSGISLGSEELTHTIKMGKEDWVKKMVTGGVRPSSNHLTEAIRMKQAGIVSFIMPKVKPDSEAYILAATQNDADLYSDLALEADIPNNKSIEIAIDNNNSEILSEGLSSGGDVNKALDYALQKTNKMAINKCLSKKKVDANKAIPFAVTNSDADMLSLILDEKEGDANKALDVAVTNDKVDMMKMALETERTSPNKHLGTIVERGHDEVARLMIEQGADANKGVLPAIQKGNKSLVDYFLSNGADASDRRFMQAAAGKDLDITEMLINFGANAEAGMSAAAKNNKVSIVQLLLDNGASADTGLKPALEGNHTETAKLLIENGSKATDVIHLPAGFGNVEIVGLLLDNGADPQKGMKAACLAGSAKVMNKMIEYGADASSSEYMDIAVQKLYAHMVPLLSDQGTDLNQKYTSGGTYIHQAASQAGCLNTVIALIKAGVPVNEKDNQGNTALHIAVMQGKENAPVIKALVEGGIDVNAENNKGHTPLKVAKNLKTKNTLKSYGAVKRNKKG